MHAKQAKRYPCETGKGKGRATQFWLFFCCCRCSVRKVVVRPESQQLAQDFGLPKHSVYALNELKACVMAHSLRVPGFVADVGVLFLLTQLRAYYRLQNDIAERDACLDNDCMCACFCGCCVLVQVADDSTADHWVAAEGSNASSDKASCCEMLSCEAPTDVR